MNRSLIFLALCLTSWYQGQSQDWQPFLSYEGRFRVMVPGSMVEKVDSIDTDIGTLAYHNFYYQEENDEESDNLLYMVSFVDYPEGSIHSDSTDLLEEFFEATIETSAFSVDGEVMYSGETYLDNYPGKVYRVDYLDGKAVIKTRAFLVENRFYSIQTITYRSRSLNTATDRFLNSLQLTHHEPKG